MDVKDVAQDAVGQRKKQDLSSARTSDDIDETEFLSSFSPAPFVVQDEENKSMKRRVTSSIPFSNIRTPLGSSCDVRHPIGDMPTPPPTDLEEPERKHPRLSGQFNPHNPFEGWEVGPKYSLIKILGHGSYGEVAMAQSVKDQTRVAIKRIQNIFDQLVDAKRIYREIYILRRLDHPQIITLLDVIVPSDPQTMRDLYLVFEFIATDLHKLILSEQYLTQAHIQFFLYQALVGLKYMHSANVIHRDIKPANVLLNEDCALKICDFGLARVIDVENKTCQDHTAQSDTEQTANPKVALTRQLTKHVATRWYRAPELILLQEYTNAVDVWSMGCIFAELLGMQRENVTSFQERKPLFPGKSCFPFSAGRDSNGGDNVSDQLSVIFEIIGSPSAEDKDAIKDEKAKQYLQNLETSSARDFVELFPGADPLALDLLKSMLMFNPARRVTVDQAIQHPYLTEVRNPESEKLAELPISMDVETVELDCKSLRERIVYEATNLFFRNSKTPTEDHEHISVNSTVDTEQKQSQAYPTSHTNLDASDTSSGYLSKASTRTSH